MKVERKEEVIVEKSPVAELANTLKRLDFYYECVKRDVEDIVMGKEHPGEAVIGLDDLAQELENAVNDIRNLAHRLREEGLGEKCG